MILPLVQHGPNAEYGTSYYYQNTDGDSRIIAVDGGKIDAEIPLNRNAESRTFFDEFFKIDRVFFSPAAAAEEAFGYLPTCETEKRKPRRSKFASALTILRITFDSTINKVTQIGLFARRPSLIKDHAHEPHTQATRSCRSHSRMSNNKWLFANNARTCGSTRSKQSHRVRKGTSTYTKRCIDQRAKQSTLFIHC